MPSATRKREPPARLAPPLQEVPPIWPIRIPASAFNLEGFRAWAVSDAFPERSRISFLDAELVIEMSSVAIFTHGAVRLEITRVICNLTQKSCEGDVFPGRTLLTNLDAAFSTEPDAIFVGEQTYRSGRVRLVLLKEDSEDGKELLGTPDWVLEVVSDSSVQKDTVQLRRLYHLAGIPEFWLIDARGDELVFDILIRAAKGYEPAQRKGTWQKSPVFGRSFRLTRKRDKLGWWDYTLQMKRG